LLPDFCDGSCFSIHHGMTCGSLSASPGRRFPNELSWGAGIPFGPPAPTSDGGERCGSAQPFEAGVCIRVAWLRSRARHWRRRLAGYYAACASLALLRLTSHEACCSAQPQCCHRAASRIFSPATSDAVADRSLEPGQPLVSNDDANLLAFGPIARCTAGR